MKIQEKTMNLSSIHSSTYQQKYIKIKNLQIEINLLIKKYHKEIIKPADHYLKQILFKVKMILSRKISKHSQKNNSKIKKSKSLAILKKFNPFLSILVKI